ncbi:hypothetical protein VPH49_22160 [Pseudomonas luteola]|uniref:hypothetical protein n=1 Tax=Pseudomonas luteola TaxID=47886 RepID=UPI003A8BAB60
MPLYNPDDKTDYFPGMADDERLERYQQCISSSVSKQQKKGIEFIVAALTGSPSAILKWFEFATTKADDTGPCVRFLSPAQRDALRERWRQDFEDAQDRKRDRHRPY